ncbi:MAG: hypothetical protein IJ077_00480 [Eubacterium sp.]|nr:hypothetical protein [Eubacterium sp.]MBR1531387.1 hypothetical protein [Eubacterium sp.]MBR2277712.1 hypothetical protein [Eubacterium sp.]
MKKIISIISSLIIICAALSASISASAAQYKAVSGTFNYSYASQVLKLVNEHRRNNGLSTLTMTEKLTDGAMIRAAETAVSFSHTRPNGEQCFTAFEWSRAAGENIAYGQRSPEQVVNSWMNSSGHRANILSANFTTIGIGCFEYGGTYYWSQAFSGGSGNAYNPGGSKAVTVNVSLTRGAQSFVQNAGAATTPSETTTKKPATTQTQETTTQKATTTNPSTTKPQTTKPSSTKYYNFTIYKWMRSFFARR